LAIEDDPDGVFSVPFDSAEVGAGDSLSVSVAFLPGTYLNYSANLLITSNDEETPTWSVPLSGIGVYAPLPDIVLDPLTLDFGVVEQDDSVLEFVNLTNAGEESLHLGSVGQSGSGAFTLTTDPSNSVVGPGSTVPVIITYSPTSSGGDDGWVAFPSDDPDEPEVELLLIGNGGADIEYPVAVVDCPGEVNPPVFTQIGGEDSYDPEGFEPLTYDWVLTQRPGGSVTELTSFAGENTGLYVDAAGDYQVKLTVTNTIGTSGAPVSCDIVGVPADALHVELSWDTAHADLDLHLMEEGGTFYESPGDCNWCNKAPKWGQTGTSDDPRLDLDDRAGFGPENINILEPADGQYTVKVHYFDDHDDDSVVATVRIYLNQSATPSFTDSQLLERNEVWEPARINWPSATVAPIDTVEPTNRRTCQ